MSKYAQVKIKKVKRAQQVQSNAVYEDLVVANPHDLKRSLKLRFLVDTGASGTVIPLEIAEKLKLQCVGEGLVEVADGRRIKTGLAYLYIKFNSDHIFTLVSYDGCTIPLLGFDVMSVLGLQVDPSRKQVLKPVRRFSLSNFILRKAWVGVRRLKSG